MGKTNITPQTTVLSPIWVCKFLLTAERSLQGYRPCSRKRLGLAPEVEIWPLNSGHMQVENMGGIPANLPARKIGVGERAQNGFRL